MLGGIKKARWTVLPGNIKSGTSIGDRNQYCVIGDVNPGASVISKGNIVIIGSCRGNVYAGASGNAECFVAALVMRPIQIRIADKSARSPIVNGMTRINIGWNRKSLT